HRTGCAEADRNGAGGVGCAGLRHVSFRAGRGVGSDPVAAEATEAFTCTGCNCLWHPRASRNAEPARVEVALRCLAGSVACGGSELSAAFCDEGRDRVGAAFCTAREIER